MKVVDVERESVTVGVVVESPWLVGEGELAMFVVVDASLWLVMGVDGAWASC